MYYDQFFPRNVDGELTCQGLAIEALAEQYQTPLYVYSQQAILTAWNAFKAPLDDFPALVCYAVKANSNLAVLQLLAQQGAGFDVVSGGELQRVIAAGGDPKKTIFSGVGKTSAEIRFALEQGIHCINIESFPELDRIEQVAKSLGVIAPVSFRINPDVDPKTHPYISTGLKENKFGIPIERAFEAYQDANSRPAIEVIGVDFHIGSQLSDNQPYFAAIDKSIELIDRLSASGIRLQHLDIGGGMGIRYQNEDTMPIQPLYDYLLPQLVDRELGLVMEPGRAIVANAGALITEVELIKNNDYKSFVVVDAAMNDLIRPALYQAWQAIEVVKTEQQESTLCDVVGPICESGDFLAKDRHIAANAGDLLAIMSAGAYSFGMSSNYNTRPRAAEVMVMGDQLGDAKLIRERETIESLYATEHLLER